MTESKKRVVVFMGGISAEREVSLMSGQGVAAALVERGFDVTTFDPATDAFETLEDGKFDAAFIALHGRLGEDGSVQGLLNCLGIPYTGPGVQASAVAMDKELTKLVWRAAGIPVPAGVRMTKREAADAARIERLIADLGAEGLVVKPERDGSSIGVTKLVKAALSPEALREAIELAAGEEGAALVEEYVHGREFTIALLDGKALPVIEIRAPEGAYDYQNKYFTDVTKYDCPADLPAEKAAEIARLSERAFAALGCRGWARVDALSRPDGSFVLLEINTSPGMTPHSLVPMAARAVGLDYPALCERVLELADLD